MRQALRREVERGNALFEPGIVLDSSDLNRIANRRWRTPCDLPDWSVLLPKLAGLAHGMQERAAEIAPSADEVIDSLAPADPLPTLPRTGGEETTALAAAMTVEPTPFQRGVVGTNLALAGRIAAQPDVRARLPGALIDELRWALVNRSRYAAADLRDRIACGHVRGDQCRVGVVRGGGRLPR